MTEPPRDFPSAPQSCNRCGHPREWHHLDDHAKQFRKKPVVVEAVQWDGTPEGGEAILAAFAGLTTSAAGITDGTAYWFIRTLEGSYEVSAGDWIIRGVLGEFDPCKDQIFQMTYEPVETPNG